MKKFLFFLILCALHYWSFAQSTQGITNVPDTSYNNRSAFASSVKSFPGIRLVEEMQFATVKEKKDITYCSVGKRKLQTDAFYPAIQSKQKRTAIIIIHGGGWRSGNRTQHYPLAQKLASLGYVCFTPEYRLSTEALFPAAVYDIKAVVRWAKKNAKRYHLDTSKVVVLGFSAGGELAAFIGNTNGDARYEEKNCHGKTSSGVHAIIDIDGTLSFVHPESSEGDDSKKISAATYWFGYTKKQNFALWEEASPLTHAGPNAVPVLSINSGVERMHAGRDDYIKKLNEYNIYSETHTFENAPHSFCLFDPWFEPTVKHIDAFLKKLYKTGK